MPDSRVGSSNLTLCVVESTAGIEVTVCTVGFASNRVLGRFDVNTCWSAVVIYEQQLPVILVVISTRLVILIFRISVG